MSQPSSSISFKGLFDTALQEYENKTKIKLADDPLAKTLEACDSVDSITAILQEQAQVFGGFKDDGKIMNSLRSSIDVLYTLSNSTIIGQVVGLIVLIKIINSGSLFLIIILQPFPPANAIFTGIGVLLAVCPLLRSHPQISVTSKFCRRSKTSAIATTRSSSFLSHSRTSSADLVSISGFLLRRLCQTFWSR